MNIKDKYANEANKRRALTLTGIEISSGTKTTSGEYINYT